jgi:hypothetical protein
VLLVGLLAGCGQLPVTGDGVVALEVTQPASLTLAAGASVQLEARALDQNGDEVATSILWGTPDTTITVDSATGLVTGVTESGIGRVQAAVGTLHSNLITFTLTAPAEGP